MRKLILFLALTAPIAAQADTCHYGSPGTTVGIAPHDTAFAEITINNNLARRHRSICRLTLFGHTAEVKYDAGAGALPDWFVVTPPKGFIAVPPKILIDDNATGRVLIVLRDGVGS